MAEVENQRLDLFHGTDRNGTEPRTKIRNTRTEGSKLYKLLYIAARYTYTRSVCSVFYYSMFTLEDEFLTQIRLQLGP